MKLLNILESKLFYSIMPIIPILAILSVTDSFYSDIEKLKKDYNKNIIYLSEQREMTINAIINNKIAQSKVQNHNMKKELINELHKSYNNNHNLIINDIKEKNVPEKLYNVYTKVLNHDYENSKIYDIIEADNLVFISNGYGILEIIDKTNPHRNSIQFRSWDDLIKFSFNKELSKKTISDIMLMRERTFIKESNYAILTNYNISNRFNINSPNLLPDIIATNDLMLYKNFDILVPTYVTIVKSPDDIIIIRELNLFNIIEPYIYSIHKYNEMIEDYKHDMNKLIFLKIIACIVIAFSLLVSFFLALLSALEKIKETR